MNGKVIKSAGLAVAVFVLMGAVLSFAEVGVTDQEIVVGQVAALSGMAQQLGLRMKTGLEVYFKSINEKGGVNGRKIRLESRNDTYEPLVCVVETKFLLKGDIFSLIGFVGTPTTKAIMPLLDEAKIPLVGPFTGAEILRNPVNHQIINIRASYYDETEGLAERLVSDLGIKKIACFYQSDAYGQAGLDGITRALKKRGLELITTGTYERNTLEVKPALEQIKKAEPEAVVMIGSYAPCAEFIRLAKEAGMNKVKFCNVSFVGSEGLKEKLGEAGEGVIISQVVPFPWNSSIPIVEEYQSALKKYAPEAPIGFISLEGFIVAKSFVKALEAMGKDVTREGLIAAFENMKNLDLGGISLSFSPQDHQGMDTVHYTVIQGGNFKEISKFQ